MVTGIISLAVLIVGIASIIILFGLVARTKAGMKQGFSFILLGMIMFVILEAIKVLKIAFFTVAAFQEYGRQML